MKSYGKVLPRQLRATLAKSFAINWQDADSSSAKGFRYSFSNEQESKVMLCGGHVGRVHGKRLEELKRMSPTLPSTSHIFLLFNQLNAVVPAKSILLLQQGINLCVVVLGQDLFIYSCKECVSDENGFYPDMKCPRQVGCGKLLLAAEKFQYDV